MKRRKILVVIPALGLLLTGCSFQEGFTTAKHWVGQNIYHPVKDWIDGLIGKKEEPTPEPTPEPEPGPVDPGVASPVEITEVRAPESIVQNATLDPASVPLSVKYSDGTTKTHAATDVKLDTSTVAQDVQGTAYYNDLLKTFTIDVVAAPVVEVFTPEEVIAKCDEAGSGVVVQPLLRVRGEVALGAKKGNNGWEGSFVTEGQKVLNFESVRSEAEYESIEGKIVTIEGYAELYNGSYKIGYLPKTASPTGEKFNPTLVSVKDAPQKTVSAIVSVEGPSKVYVGDELSVDDFIVNVEYSDGTTGQVRPDAIVSGDASETGERTIVVSVGELEGSCKIVVEDKPTTGHAGTEEDPYTGADAVLVANALGADEATTDSFYIEGVVEKFSENFNAEYGNYSFEIDGGFVGWRLKKGPQLAKFSDGDLKVGDTVTIFCKIQNYKGTTPESKDGYIYKINDEKQGEDVPPIDPSVLTERVTFELGENGDAAHADGSSTTTYTETVAGVTLQITDGEKMFQGARDAKGNGCLKFGTSSLGGSFKINVADVSGLEKVVFNVANYKSRTDAKISIDGGEQIEISGKSDAGEYDVVEAVVTSGTVTVAFPGRAMLNSIEFVPSEGPVVGVESVAIDQGNQTLHLGNNEPSQVQLSATVLPEDATSKTVSWLSSETGVATISADGLVQAVAAGTTQITAAAGGVTSEAITVTVIQHVESVTIPSSQGVVVGGEAVTLSKTIAPANVDYTSAVWSVEDVLPEGAIAIDATTGEISASQAGTANVYLTVDGVKSNACAVTATANVIHVESVSLNPEELNLEVGQNSSLVATVSPEGATYPEVSWKSSDEEIAKVDDNGVVTGIAVGEATITAEADGKSATCVVTVEAAAPEKGTAENPYTVDELLTAYGNLGENQWSESRVYVTGEVIAISNSPEYTLKGTNGNLAVYKPTSALGEEDVLPCVGDVAVFEGFVERYVYSTTDKIELTGYAKDTVEAHQVFPTIQSVVSRGTSEISLDANSSQNATVTFEGTATNASEYSFTVLIAEGYELTAVTVNGNALEGENGVYSFIVKGNSVIKVTTHEAGQEVPDPWDYTFTQTTWSEAGNQTLDGHVWTMSGTGGEYFGYDATKGQQFGSGKKPYTALTLSCSDFSGTIASIDVYTSGAASIAGDVQVSVGGTSFGDAQALSATNTKYTFSLEEGATGEVQISWSQTSSKAIYIKQIVVTFK